MIFGIGTDIVAVRRMQEALQRHGDRFADRILTPYEMEGYTAAPHKARFLAKRFAAKEAAAKALGTGFSDGLSLHHIEVIHDNKGRPGLAFSERGAELLEQYAVGETFLSIADEHDYAVAYVTMMRR